MNRGTEAELGRFFTDQGWSVRLGAPNNALSPDLELRQGARLYVAEVKAAAEARSDRVIALLSQAVLQAQAFSKRHPDALPLALVHIKELPDALVRRVVNFATLFTPNVAIGLFGADGRRYFEGDGLSGLTNLGERPVSDSLVPAPVFNLFSGLNQWMMKVLLAPDIPVEMLSAPRDPFRSGTELAKAAGVSAMSVSRFLTALRKDGFLAPGRTLKLVRREELFRRWQASVVRAAPEQAFRYLVPGAEDAQLTKFIERYRDDACIGLRCRALLLPDAEGADALFRLCLAGGGAALATLAGLWDARPAYGPLCERGPIPSTRRPTGRCRCCRCRESLATGGTGPAARTRRA